MSGSLDVRGRPDHGDRRTASVVAFPVGSAASHPPSHLLAEVPVSELLVRVSGTDSAPTVIAVSGDIDMVSAPQLRGHLLALPDRSTVVELSGVRLLAAPGLTELVCLRNRLVRVHASLAIAAARPLARRILQATAIADTVILADTVEEAVGLLTTRSQPRRRFRAP